METALDASWAKEHHQILIEIDHNMNMQLLKAPLETPVGVLISHSFVDSVWLHTECAATQSFFRVEVDNCIFLLFIYLANPF